jgi:Uncharacterized protein conserved in bacteria
MFFLGSPYVFKVKKKVNFGFLDFSSLKNRRYYSEREVISIGGSVRIFT